ncbi:MAG: sensor histidine kinase [Ancrocorticia sp.]
MKQSNRANRVGTNRVRANRVGTNRVRPNRVGTNRVRPNRVGTNRVRPNRVGPNGVRPNRIREFFGVDDEYVRPKPANPWLFDGLVALVFFTIASSMVLYTTDNPETAYLTQRGPALAAVGIACVLVAFRRTFPITVLVLVSGVHFIAIGSFLPSVAAMMAMQTLYFIGIYTAMAYARRRDRLMWASSIVITAMVVWYVVADLYNRSVLGAPPSGWYYVASLSTNFAFFIGAFYLGRQAYLQAKFAEELRQATAMVEHQSQQLADQAVLGERLRIARDLHDSVAHHISLMGVQTAAARRVMSKRPELATEAMLEVEELSRSAVEELREMLGSLRGIEPSGDGTAPGSLERLCAEASCDNLRVTYDLVGDRAALATLTGTQRGTLLRVAQEALTNVRRHSSASEARVVLRLNDDGVELEVTDNGMPIPGTSGSGLGQVGMRERVGALGGELHAGPRATRGYRVHAVFPSKVAVA